MLVVEPGGEDDRDEELAAVGVPPGVGHGQQAHLVVLLREVLIVELVPVDRFASGTVATGEVTALQVFSRVGMYMVSLSLPHQDLTKPQVSQMGFLSNRVVQGACRCEW